MNRPCARWLPALAILLLQVAVSEGRAESNHLQRVETKTLDGEEFLFPDDLNAPVLNIVLLAVSEEKDNGAWQGEALLDWYAGLEQAGVLSEDIRA